MQEYHDGVRCNACGTEPLYGMRFKCGNCADYDLCADCFLTPTQHGHDTTHVFMVLVRPLSDAVEHALEVYAKPLLTRVLYEDDAAQPEPPPPPPRVEQQPVALPSFNHVLAAVAAPADSLPPLSPLCDYLE